jgi:hypothetical protein
MHVVGVRVRQRLAADLEPRLHHLDLIFLRDRDAHAQLLHVRIERPLLQQVHHLHGLRVVADHPLHEGHVRFRELHLRQIGRRGFRDNARRLPRRTGLDDFGTRLRRRHRAGGGA